MQKCTQFVCTENRQEKRNKARKPVDVGFGGNGGHDAGREVGKAK